MVSTFTICSTAFASLARLVATSLKPELERSRLGFVDHPLGGISAAELAKRVDQVWPPLEAWLDEYIPAGIDPDAS